MKKLVLAVLFLGGITAQATTVTDLDHNTTTGIRYIAPQSISFIEIGVQFVVFTNGQFDFVLNRPYSQVQNFGRRGNGRNAPGHTYGVSYRNTRRNFVNYDRFGYVTKVGRNFIHYNRYGEVNQIGNVSLRYRNGRLVRVGNMKLVYNRRGVVVDLIGYVHHHNLRRNDRQLSRRSFNDGYLTGRDYDNRNNNWHGKNALKKRNRNKSRQDDD